MKQEQNKVFITTGDDVSDVVWTKEKLEELQRIVDKIKEEEKEDIRYSFELSDIKVTDNQWNQIKDVSRRINNTVNDSLQD